jgi:hypothetical protein
MAPVDLVLELREVLLLVPQQRLLQGGLCVLHGLRLELGSVALQTVPPLPPSGHQTLHQPCPSLTTWVAGDASPKSPVLHLLQVEVHYFIPLSHSPHPYAVGCPSPSPPPIVSATNVINVLSNVFSWNCDYAQGISKPFTVITGKGLGEYSPCVWSEL